MRRTERELRKKHAMELKQQPKSLKVSDKLRKKVFLLSGSCLFFCLTAIIFNFFDRRFCIV